MTKVIGRGRYATETYPAPRGLGGEILAPLSRYYFVDPNTTVPGEDQNGSVEAPYSTVQAGVDAITPFFTGTLVVTDTVFGSTTIPDNVSVTILGTDNSVGNFVLGENAELVLANAWGNIATGDPAHFATVFMTADRFTGGGVEDLVTSIAVPAGNVTLSGIGISGPVAAQALQLLNCSLGTGATIAAVDLNAVNVYFLDAVTMNFASGPQIFKSCEFRNGVPTITNVDPVQFDSYSDARFTAASGTASGGSVTVG